VRFTMKKAWRDGTRAIVLEPLDLVARLCAMVPPPRLHLVRYHGVLAPHAGLRCEVVPATNLQAPVDRRPRQMNLFDELEPEHDRRKPWASILRRVFQLDVRTCPCCAGPMRWLEIATTPAAIAKLLARHGVGPRAPPLQPVCRGQLKLPFSA
jgi:hypothetical protein